MPASYEKWYYSLLREGEGGRNSFRNSPLSDDYARRDSSFHAIPPSDNGRLSKFFFRSARYFASIRKKISRFGIPLAFADTRKNTLIIMIKILCVESARSPSIYKYKYKMRIKIKRFGAQSRKSEQSSTIRCFSLPARLKIKKNKEKFSRKEILRAYVIFLSAARVANLEWRTCPFVDFTETSSGFRGRSVEDGRRFKVITFESSLPYSREGIFNMPKCFKIQIFGIPRREKFFRTLKFLHYSVVDYRDDFERANVIFKKFAARI